MDALIMDMGSNVKGESTLEGYKGKIELLSFSHGAGLQPTDDLYPGGRTSGRNQNPGMSVTKYLDSTSPTLNRACIEGEPFPEVNIIITRNDGDRTTEVMRYKLTGVLISSISINGGGGDKPIETLTLNYNHISWDYAPQRPGEPGVDKSK